MIVRHTDLNRRKFLQHASRAVVVFPVLGLGIAHLSSCARKEGFLARPALADKASPNVSWKTAIVSDKEPGEPLIVSGTIYSPDGRKPLEGINLYVYQTDATGHYSTLTESGGDNRNTRLHGLMRTNAEGRYEFRTIKPAPYPQARIAAHIHAYVSGPGYPEYWIDEYHFDDDAFLTDDMRRRFGSNTNFSSILKLTRGSGGILRGVRDIKIERCTNNCTGQ